MASSGSRLSSQSFAVSSPARNPELFAYMAAQNRLGAPVLFSHKKVSDLLDPSIKATKTWGEIICGLLGFVAVSFAGAGIHADGPVGFLARCAFLGVIIRRAAQAT